MPKEHPTKTETYEVANVDQPLGATPHLINSLGYNGGASGQIMILNWPWVSRIGPEAECHT